MVDRTCRFISNRGATQSPSTSIAEEVYESFIQPVVTENFPDFTVHLFEYDNEPGSIADDFLEKTVDADLVIADLSELSPSAYFQLGVRHNSGKPLVYIADEEYVLPLHPTEFEFVRYRFDSAFYDDKEAASDLVAAIRTALDESRSRTITDPLPKALSPRQTRAQLAARLSEAAEAIRLLRINSAAEMAIELESIANELKQVPDDRINPALQETIDKFLKLLSRFAEQLATIRGSRMLISGLISIVLGGAGLPAVTAFGLSLAFWEGKDAFIRAIEAFNKKRK